MTGQWIAERTFVLRHRDGTSTPIHVAIGAPRQMGPDEWSCAVSLRGAYEDISPTVGGDALQALGLAWALAKHLLTSLGSSGDVLEYENGEVVPLSAYFDPQPASGQ